MVENATLVKFGQYNHICQLRDEGLLFMNSLRYFRQIEDDELRGDKYDSVDELRRGNYGNITPNDSNNPFKITNWTLGIGPAQLDKRNIFCMCAVRPSMGTFPIDTKNNRFGDYALVFKSPQIFLDRISSQVKLQNIQAEANLVEYIFDDFSGVVGPFKKLRRFSYQSE
jgi:hypothetical protein